MGQHLFSIGKGNKKTKTKKQIKAKKKQANKK